MQVAHDPVEWRREWISACCPIAALPPFVADAKQPRRTNGDGVFAVSALPEGAPSVGSARGATAPYDRSTIVIRNTSTPCRSMVYKTGGPGKVRAKWNRLMIGTPSSPTAWTVYSQVS